MSNLKNHRFTERTSTNLGRSHRLPCVFNNFHQFPYNNVRPIHVLPGFLRWLIYIYIHIYIYNMYIQYTHIRKYKAMQSSGKSQNRPPISRRSLGASFRQGSSQSGCWDIVAGPHCWADWNLAEIDLHLARGEGCHQDIWASYAGTLFFGTLTHQHS